MILFSKEALKKICPIRHIDGTINKPCLGSSCMLWKYWIPPNGIKIEKEPHGKGDSEKRGYCGLGG